ncbi:unnamed protein product [Cuscuta epithymum]|uniref:Coilin n=1 Tax=Cuscuta epithymum TaxID=186058 RepID=A0AAV0FWE5_9ASTE|nr:unnamed protein product [Cuscuta epithymum]
MGEGLRIKVVFEDGDILHVSQKSEGLERSWLLLNPKHHTTISEFSSYLLQNFQLHNSCPNGILLSMEGYVLPPFESTCFFNDKDVISVRKKGGSLTRVGDAPSYVDNLQIVKKESVNSKPVCLGNEVFAIKTGGYEMDEPEKERRDQVHDYNSPPSDLLADEFPVSKKRKASEKLNSLKKKRKKKKEYPQVAEGCNIDIQPEPTKKSKRSLTDKKSSKKQMKKSESHKMNGTESNGGTAKISERNVTKLDMTKNDQILKSGKDCVAVTAKPEEMKKLPSRSSRRQYAKRKFKKEMTKILKENENSQLENTSKEIQSKNRKREGVRFQQGHRKWKKGRANDQRHEDKYCKQKQSQGEIEETPDQPKGLLYWMGLLSKDMAKDKSKPEHANSKSPVRDELLQSSDIDHEVVPVEVRPEHICSELSGKEQTLKKNQAQEKLSSEKITTSQRTEINEPHKDPSEISSAENFAPGNGSIDFAKLPSLSDAPKEGDVIAYRLLEVSSNWTAELSPYHVGKVLSFNFKSSRASLMPVAGYPFYSTKNKPGEDECTMKLDSSLYREDGSLEIDLSSLVDVRAVKPPTLLLPLKVDSIGNTNDKSRPSGQENRDIVNHESNMCGGGSSRESREDLWEQLSVALSAKKEQLSQQSSCWGKVIPSKSSWSYEACGLQPRKGFSRWKKQEMIR